MPGQVVEGTVRLLVCCQHLGIDYNLRQLGAARFCLRSPVVGQLTPPAPSRAGHRQSKRQNNPHDPGLLAERRRSEVRTDAQDDADGSSHRESSAGISAHTSNDTDSIAVPSTRIQTRLWSPKYQSTGEQSSLMTLSRPHDTIAANAGSVLTHSRLLQKNQRNFFLYLKLEEVRFLRAFGPACKSSKILGEELTNKGTTSHQ